MTNRNTTSPQRAAANPVAARAVKIISRKQNLALVEWVEGDHLYRSLMPEHTLTLSADDRTADCRNPEEGVPYGAPWANLLPAITVTGAQIEAGLHRAGVWTVNDLLAAPTLGLAVLQSVIGLDLSVLIDKARAWQAAQPAATPARAPDVKE